MDGRMTEEHIILDFGTHGPVLENCESCKLIVRPCFR